MNRIYLGPFFVMLRGQSSNLLVSIADGFPQITALLVVQFSPIVTDLLNKGGEFLVARSHLLVTSAPVGDHDPATFDYGDQFSRNGSVRLAQAKKKLGSTGSNNCFRGNARSASSRRREYSNAKEEIWTKGLTDFQFTRSGALPKESAIASSSDQ